MDLFMRTGWLDPFQEIRRVQRDIDRLFGQWAEGGVHEFPLVNLWASEEGVVVSAELPGVDPADVRITAHANTLTISGERASSQPDAKAEALRRELPTGAFTRTVTLPFAVEPDTVNAHSEAGVLVIHLPVPEANRPRRIPITTV